MKKRPLLIIIILALAAVCLWVLQSRMGQESEPVPTISLVGSQEAPVLSGQVVDALGQGVAGAIVFVDAYAVEATDTGHFSLPSLPPGEHPVDARAEGYVRPGIGPLGRVTVSITDDEPLTDLRLVLQQSASISGQIVAAGAPIGGAGLSLSYDFAQGLDGYPLEPFTVSDLGRSGADGTFELTGIAPGRMQILVESEVYPFAESHQISLRADQVKEGLIIDIAPSSGIRGTVVNQDGEALRAQLSVTSAAFGRTWRMTSDASGFYEFSHLGQGLYTLHVEAPNYLPETIEDLEIGSEEITDRDIVLTSNQVLMGRVVEPDGSPVPAAVIDLSGGDASHRVQANEEGYFQWDPATRGAWTAIASSPRHDPSAATRLHLGREVVLQVTPGGAIRGRVVDGRRPVPEYTISVAFPEFAGGVQHHHRQLASTTVDDRRGRFEIGPLPSGRYRLIVSSADHAPTTTDPITVSAGRITEPVVIRMESGSVVSGTIRDRQTQEPIAGVHVTISSFMPDDRQVQANTDADGRFVLEDVPSGLQSFRVHHGDYITQIFSGVSVPLNGSLTYDMEIEPIGDGPGGYAFNGIGAAVGRNDEGIEVISVVEDSPALIAGLYAGDTITAIDGRSVADMTLDQVIERLRGEEGVSVLLDVQREGGRSLVIDVERERVFVPQPRRRHH